MDTGVLKNVTGQLGLKDKWNKLKYTVMQTSSIEIKVREVTSNDPWGAKSTDKELVAEATNNYEDFKVVMSTLMKRLNDNGKNWRHVFKGLQLLEYLIVHGAERVIDDARENAYTIRTLRNFKYVDENGKDCGAGIRDLSQKLVELLKNDAEIKKMRKEAQKMRGKFSGVSSDAQGYTGKSRYDDDEGESRRRRNDDDEDRPRKSKFADDEEEEAPKKKFGDDDFEADFGDDDDKPKQKVRAPGRSAENSPRKPQQQQQQQPQQKTKEAPLFDDFFNQPVQQPQQSFHQQQQRTQPQQPFHQQQQVDDWDAGFDQQHNANSGFDDGFGGNDPFNDFQKAETHEPKKDSLFDITKGLVDFDLSNDKKPQQTHHDAPKQKMTLNQLRQQQGIPNYTTTAAPARSTPPMMNYPQQPASQFGQPAPYGGYPQQQQQQQQPPYGQPGYGMPSQQGFGQRPPQQPQQPNNANPWF